MSHRLLWPGKHFFYPIGNTPAVCLTRDIAPEERGDILLLGCGDPRSILYTIFTEPDDGERSLDFTCCDIDPAVLARNVILFTMVADREPIIDVVWNIFYNMYLDKRSHQKLVDHCNKLISLSENLQQWTASSYGRFIKMGTEYTLSEIRRHWVLYSQFESLPAARRKAIYNAFSEASKSTLKRFPNNLSSARGAGPLIAEAAPVAAEQFSRYWKTGVTFSDPKRVAAARLLNPTFVYSIGGEGYCVHYAIDPMQSFHLAPIFANAKRAVSVSDMVAGAIAQFRDWCSAVSGAVGSKSSPPIIRFILGEATAVCSALQVFLATTSLDSDVLVGQWKTQLMQLNREEYVSACAPVQFNVIDTSNLHDHVGLLNVLVSVIPLLSTSQRPSVLYTESLLVLGNNATKEFTERMPADIGVLALLLGLCPIDYLSGFTSRSNTHELMTVTKKTMQFHQATTWKSPASGDAVAVHGNIACRPLTFEPSQLGTFLFDFYQRLFEQEDASYYNRDNEKEMLKAISVSNLLDYTRETFVIFLKLPL